MPIIPSTPSFSPFASSPSPVPLSNTRVANDLMIEISGHLVEDIVNATLFNGVAPTTPPAPSTLFVSSTLAMYPGAQVVIPSTSGTLDVITLLTVDPTTNTVTALITNSYFSGVPILGATFPTQQATDPLFTQSEILGYLARAQNEFLSKLPCIYQFTSQSVDLGVELQAAPSTAIEIERVSIQGTRLYEVSQTQLSMADPNWAWGATPALPSTPIPTSWFQDRTGFYGWGLAPIPQTGFTADLLTSARGPDTLALNSLFLVPDPMVHAVKYKALEYIWSKDGEQRSPSMMRVARSHFDSIVAIASRFLDGVVNAPLKR